jgi:hypothetical protein
MPESMRLFVSEADRQELAKWLRASNTRRSHAERAGISNYPRFTEKVPDVVGLYLNPPDDAVVLSVDEKTQIQPAVDRPKRSIATNQTGH